MMSVLYIGDGHGGVGDPVVDNRVHGHRHRVLRQYLQKKVGKTSSEEFFVILLKKLPPKNKIKSHRK